MNKVLLLLGLLALLTSCSGDSSQSSAPLVAPGTLGSFAIGHTMFTVVDEARDDRELIVNAWYPVDDEDAVSGPLTEYPLQSVFTLASEVAVDDLPVSSAGPAPFLVFSHGFGG
ncbi:MAG: lipoprotein, partial [Polyangiales bacterium]